VITVVAGILHRNDHLLLTRRRPDAHLPNLWEFPGGKVEDGETLEIALQREMMEELGIEVRVGDLFFQTTHTYPERSIALFFFNCTIAAGDVQAIDVTEFRWVKTSDLSSLEFPEADRELIKRLARPHLSA